LNNICTAYIFIHIVAFIHTHTHTF
jgi:hypothetical protein